MDAVTSWLLAAVAAWAVATMLVPRHLPRRFPEDDVVVAPRGRAAWRVATPEPRSAVESDPTRRRARRSCEPSLDDLAVCCDLLAVAAASGSTVSGSIVAVGSVGRGPVARSLGRSAARIRNGEALATAIESLRSDLGPAGQPLVTTLAAAASSGLAPGPALARLADAERRRARRRVEARVRRLPVLLLLPLVGLILPAFVLLTLVPVGLSAADGAGLTAGSPSMATAPPIPAPVSVPASAPEPVALAPLSGRVRGPGAAAVLSLPLPVSEVPGGSL